MKLWFYVEIHSLTQETRSLTVKSQTQPPLAGRPRTSAVCPTSRNMQLSWLTIKDNGRAFVLFPKGLLMLYLSNEWSYLCHYGKITGSFNRSDATAWEQQPEVQKPATFQPHITQHHNSPSKLILVNAPPYLIQTSSFTCVRHILSPKKPAFSRDTTDKDLDQTCAVTLFSETGGIQEQAPLQPHR